MSVKPVSVSLCVEHWLQNALTAPGPLQDNEENLLEPSWSFEHQAIKLRERERANMFPSGIFKEEEEKK